MCDETVLNGEQVRDLLRKACADEGGLRAWGRKHNLTASFISQVLLGRANVTDAIGRELGLSRVVLWEIDNARTVA